MDTHHPPDDGRIDELLRRALAVADPTEVELARAERLLAAAMATPAEPRRRRWRLAAGLAAAAALVAAVAIGVAVSRPSPAEAALSEIASATRRIPERSVRAQSFAYTRSEVTALGVIHEERFGDGKGPLAYLLPEAREVWKGSGGVVKITTTVGQPVFFNPGDRDRYYQAGMDSIDRVGETYSDTVTGATDILDEQDWPTDPKALAGVIRSLRPDGGPGYFLAIALDLLRETRAGPQLRAAAIGAIASLPQVTLVNRGDHQATFRFDGPGTVKEVDTFTFTDGGFLIAETETLPDGDPTLGVPPGTVIEDIRYQPTRIVDSLDEPPP